jgi:predicted GNAT family acetyltransferase
VHTHDSVSIEVGGKTATKAWLMWRSPQYAEIAVETEQEYRGRGFAKAAVIAISNLINKQGIEPVYVVSSDNKPSIMVAEAIGFKPCKMDEFAGYVDF